mmetsp:Transcript_17729/g.53351  ORF Transcript_17729/g.53351 Transcript_17729/m.53351 type:complete len:89 (-) Transcript_17729:4952-5218(-)
MGYDTFPATRLSLAAYAAYIWAAVVAAATVHHPSQGPISHLKRTKDNVTSPTLEIPVVTTRVQLTKHPVAVQAFAIAAILQAAMLQAQ